MVEKILNNLNDNKIRQKVKNQIKKNDFYINNFIKSSPYAYSILLNYPELLDVFFYYQKKFLREMKEPVKKNDIKNSKNGFLNSENYTNELSEKYNEINNYTDYDSIFFRLRDIKNKEMLIIGIKDFFELTSVKETTFLISSLADFCIEKSIKGAMLKLYDHNTLSLDDLQYNIFIIGMGKLGGRELNYSSDIDLIFFSNYKFLSFENNSQELSIFIKYFLNFLREISSKGFLYRVDLRLRPEGSTGPIIMGINSAIEYYKERARNWEYQALVKNRFIWGNYQLYNNFIESINPLIYSHVPPQNILRGIKEIKDKIEKNIKPDFKEINIKLSPGGIRDIEFIIQFLQLIHGIRYLEIRKTNSIEALNVLKTYNIITSDEYNILINNYILFRKIENILQFSNNLSVQNLPEDKNDIIKIFSGWNLKSINLDNNIFLKDFKKIIKNRMVEVRNIFRILFDETIKYIYLKNNLLKNYSDLSKELIENHFYRMDSEYFLRFKENEIANHIQMIKRLNKDNLSELHVEKINNNEWKLTIIAFDYTYEFSKISGIISANYLEILEGESFTYCNYDPKLFEKEKNRFFYRRHNKKIYTENQSILNEKSLLRKRKIVCFTKVKSFNKDNVPNWKKLKNELEELLNLLEHNKQKEAAEILNIKIIDVLKNIHRSKSQSLTPIEIEIDNNSSSQYTILLIKSSNSFAFLYTFTNVLSMRNYYIYKVEINTINNTVEDRLFIMTRDGHKITSTRKIRNLEITITLIKQYSALLFNSINPNNALLYFDELLTRILESEEKKELPILGQKDVMEKLAKIFGISDFIWEDLFRFNYSSFIHLLDDKIIEKKYNKQMLFNIFNNKYCNNKNFLDIEFSEFTTLINKFKDEESFRIDLKQILKKTDFWQFAEELTDLAEIIIEIAFLRIEFELLKKNKFKITPPWAVFGLGKLGGKELGFASDIELMFIYDIPLKLKDDLTIINYFEDIVRIFLKTIKTKREGIFEIDLNLRPYGKKGKLAVSVNNFKKYFSDKGEAYFFEKQALTKLRYITSNKSGIYLKKEILKNRDNFVYNNQDIDLTSFKKIRNMQLENYLKPNNINVKYTKGGLVDIEYIVQILQIKYGFKYPSIRKHSTIEALDSLFNEKLISRIMYKELKASYIFFRNLINILRMVKGNSKDLTIYNENQIEIGYLTKRSHFIGIIEENSEQLLFDKLKFHISVTKKYFDNLIK